MIIATLVFQGLALLGLALWWPSWSGKNTRWLERRGWGWRPLIWLFTAVFFQALAFTSLTMPTAEEAPTWDADFLVVLGSVLLFLAGPITLIGAYFWWPRFMLPGWIRERLRAGDPVKTAYPLP